jgi:hypothetical protein
MLRRLWRAVGNEAEFLAIAKASPPAPGAPAIELDNLILPALELFVAANPQLSISLAIKAFVEPYRKNLQAGGVLTQAERRALRNMGVTVGEAKLDIAFARWIEGMKRASGWRRLERKFRAMTPAIVYSQQRRRHHR